MNEELAEKVYLFILKYINGWDEKQLKDLSKNDMYIDPIFKDLCKL